MSWKGTWNQSSLAHRRWRRRGWLPAIGLVFVLSASGLAACGSSSSSSSGASSGTNGTSAPSTASSASGKATLTVSAAASLKKAFTVYSHQFTGAQLRFSFAGSDTLAAQIEQGVKPDVFASANTKLPQRLFAKGLVDKPVVFAANRLVIAVPAGSSKVHSLADLERPGATLVVGSRTVPIGAYTDEVLSRLGPTQSRRILSNVRSQEPDVSGIVGKLTQGAADAGFTYVTDVKATKGALRAIPLPDSLQPKVAYAVAIVTGTQHHNQARLFVEGLRGEAAQEDLYQAGFLPPPSP